MNQVVTLPTAVFVQTEQFRQQLLERLMKAGLLTGSVESVLERCGNTLATEMAMFFYARIEAIRNLIIREVTVNYHAYPESLLPIRYRRAYINRAMFKLMPSATLFRGEKKIKIGVFKPDHSMYREGVINNISLRREYEIRNLRPDLWAAFALNIAYPDFADTHPNGTACQDPEGNWHYVAFGRWPKNCERYVIYDQQQGGWADRWYHVGRVLE